MESKDVVQKRDKYLQDNTSLIENIPSRRQISRYRTYCTAGDRAREKKCFSRWADACVEEPGGEWHNTRQVLFSFTFLDFCDLEHVAMLIPVCNKHLGLQARAYIAKSPMLRIIINFTHGAYKRKLKCGVVVFACLHKMEQEWLCTEIPRHFCISNKWVV